VRAEQLTELVTGPDPFAPSGEESVFADVLAEGAAWRVLRAAAWQSPELEPGTAPHGAKFDGLLPDVGRWSSAEQKRDALAAVAWFRRSHRSATRELGQAFERYVTSLRAADPTRTDADEDDDES
jgi:hypothetical protein